MMDFRQRIEQGRNTTAKETLAPEAQVASEYFAISSPAITTLCLDLRLAEGKHVALPYSYIHTLRYDPETGITLATSREQVTITGRNLTRLFEYLLLFRVRHIQTNQGGDAQEDGVFVEEIRVEVVDR